MNEDEKDLQEGAEKDLENQETVDADTNEELDNSADEDAFWDSREISSKLPYNPLDNHDIM